MRLHASHASYPRRDRDVWQMPVLTLVLILILVSACAHPSQAQTHIQHRRDDRDSLDDFDDLDDPHGWLSLNFFASFLNERIDYSTINLRAGFALSGGYRFNNHWGLLASIERNNWIQTEVNFEFRRGTVNLSVGGEFFYFDRAMRAALFVGAAMLVADQPLDPAPSFGVFAEVRPAGIRWSVHPSWTVQLDPISLAVVAPVLREPVLVDIQYRITLTMEWRSKSDDRTD